MMDFALWFLGELPAFLMTPPISAFVGMFFLFVVVALVRQIISAK